ncbi:flippase [bacterium]|nr:flippase [bacterium]
MNTAQRILKNLLSLLSAGIVTNLLGFMAIVYLARVLGPGDFGKINFAFAIVIYFTLIANLGLPLLGTREVARDRRKVKDYTGNILTLRLCLAFLGFGLLLLMAFFLNKPPEIKYLIILYGLGLIPSALLLDWAFQGVEKMEYIGLGRILSSGIYLALVLGFIKSSEQLLLIPCFQIVGSLLVAGLLFFIFIKNFGKPRFRFDLSPWKGLLKAALPIGFSLFMVQVFYNIDTVMLGFMRTNEEVGYYNAAYKIILTLIMAMGAYHDTIFPIISDYYKTSLVSLKKILSYTSKLMVTASLPLAVGGTILARPIMNLLYGTRYESGIVAFQILIWMVVIIWVNTIYSRGLLACDRQNKYAIAVTVGAISNIILNFLLIPPLGLKGAAIATLVTEGVLFLIYYVEFSKIIKVQFKSYILRPLIAALIMGAFLQWNIEWNIFLLIVTGVSIYLGFLYFMKGITREEISIIQRAISRNK